MTAKATIKDIQRETGLSLGTISKYINGGTLKANNKKKIEEAIDKLNYHVDPFARIMITGKTNTIGLLIPELGNAFYGSIASYLDHYLRKNNYELLVKESSNNPKHERNCINWFIERKMDAIICFSICDESNIEFYKHLNYDNMVFVDNKMEDLNYDFVGINNYEISKHAVKYLLDNGHKKIDGLFVKDTPTSLERLRGYIDAYKESNIELDESKIHMLSNDLNTVCDDIKKILDKKASTAIYASNYITTLGSIFCINERSLSVPNDISLLGFDNIMLTNIYTPTISIVEQPLKKIAEVVVNRVVELNKTNPSERIDIRLECNFNEGSSIRKIN